VIDTGGPSAGRLGVEFVRVAYDHARLTAALARTALITTFDGPANA
jgi:hypothetical protein